MTCLNLCHKFIRRTRARLHQLTQAALEFVPLLHFNSSAMAILKSMIGSPKSHLCRRHLGLGIQELQAVNQAVVVGQVHEPNVGRDAIRVLPIASFTSGIVGKAIHATSLRRIGPARKQIDDFFAPVCAGTEFGRRWADAYVRGGPGRPFTPALHCLLYVVSPQPVRGCQSSRRGASPTLASVLRFWVRMRGSRCSLTHDCFTPMLGRSRASLPAHWPEFTPWQPSELHRSSRQTCWSSESAATSRVSSLSALGSGVELASPAFVFVGVGCFVGQQTQSDFEPHINSAEFRSIRSQRLKLIERDSYIPRTSPSGSPPVDSTAARDIVAKLCGLVVSIPTSGPFPPSTSPPFG